jgi:hypothetical protein
MYRMASSSLVAAVVAALHPKVEADVSFSTRRPRHERSNAAHLARERVTRVRVIKLLGLPLDHPPRVSDGEELPVNDPLSGTVADQHDRKCRKSRAAIPDGDLGCRIGFARRAIDRRA